MSSIVKLAVLAIAIAVTAAIVGIVAYDRGRAAPRDSAVRYALNLKSPAPVVDASVRGVIVRAQPGYRLRLAPNTVVELRRGPRCSYLTWRTIRTGGGAR